MDDAVHRLLVTALVAGIPLTAADIEEDDEPTIDGMPAEQWLDAMTMD